MQNTKKINIHSVNSTPITPIKTGSDQRPLKLVSSDEQVIGMPQIRDKVLTRKRKMSQHPLRDLRLRAGFTLEELAELTEMSPSYLSRLESGTRRLNADILQRLSIALTCNPADLLPYSNPHVVSYVDHQEAHTSTIKVMNSDHSVPANQVKASTQQSYACDQIVGSEILTYSNCKASQIIVDTAKVLQKDVNVLIIPNDNQAYIGKVIELKKGQFADQPVHMTIELINDQNQRQQCNLARNSVKSIYCIIGHIEAQE